MSVDSTNGVAGVAPRVAYGSGKAAASFKAHTLTLATDLGWEVYSHQLTPNKVTFTKEDLSITVTYSAQDYVRFAEGSLTLVPGDSKKWVKLNEALSTLVPGNGPAAVPAEVVAPASKAPATRKAPASTSAARQAKRDQAHIAEM